MLARLASGSPCGTARTMSSWPISMRVSLAGSVGPSMMAMSSWASAGALGEYRCGVVAEPDGDAGVGTPEAGQQGRQVDRSEGLDRSDVPLAAQDAADAGDGVAA